MMTLVLQFPDGRTECRELPDSDFAWNLGRADGSDLVLAAGDVSRRHATLSRMSGTLVLADAESRGGTWMNGERLVAPQVLAAGDEFRVGSFRLRIESRVSAAHPEPPPPAPSPAPVPDSVPDDDFSAADILYTDECMVLKRRLHEHILGEMNLTEDALKEFADETTRAKLDACVDSALRQFRHELPAQVTLPDFRQALMDELVGYGPLSPILRDKGVSEIMVNGPERIFIERKGRLRETGVRFYNERHLIQIIQRIVEPLGRHVDEASPMVDARLPDGSRVNAVIPPLALDGASMTIRKFADKKLTTEDLVGFGSMTEEMAAFLKEAVRVRKNILVSGGTGSGKTTLLNVLSQFIPGGERVVTVEDSAELKLSHRNIVRLEARPANIEGKGRIAIRDLVINCLRMRPDRIIVGECRGAEALDMLQAMNTGHDGSLTTAHANNPRDALSRLENMVMMAGFELPSSAIREQIASAIDLIVQQTRLPDGSRKIVKITEVTGREADMILLQDIFVFEQDGFDSAGKVRGRHTATGNIPCFVDELRKSGDLRLDMSVFVPKT
ncbi:MAG: ATPase, T2SS/T4P/T4SS family [Kiritimatiellia bacterium]